MNTQKEDHMKKSKDTNFTKKLIDYVMGIWFIILEYLLRKYVFVLEFLPPLLLIQRYGGRENERWKSIPPLCGLNALYAIQGTYHIARNRGGPRVSPAACPTRLWHMLATHAGGLKCALVSTHAIVYQGVVQAGSRKAPQIASATNECRMQYVAIWISRSRYLASC